MFFNKLDTHKAVRNLVLTAMFAACYVVLSRLLSFQTETMKIGTTFIAMALAGYTLGPVGAAISVGIGDLISAMLFMPGSYLPQLTLTYMLGAFVEGILLKGMFGTNKLPLIVRVIISVLFFEGVCSLLLNSYWLWCLFAKGRTYLVFLAPRAMQAVVMTLVQIPVIYLLGKLNERVFSKVLKD